MNIATDKDDNKDNDLEEAVIDSGEAPSKEAHGLPPERKSTGRVYALCAMLFIAIMVVAGGGYYWQGHRYQTDIKQLREDISKLQSTGARVTEELQASLEGSREIAAGQTLLKEQINGIGQSQSDVEKAIRALYDREDQSSVDWILAEAEYLVLAAIQRLALEGDVETAAAALRAADERLQSAAHPGLIPVREQIIKDSHALAAVNQPDVEGLAIYLAGIIGKVNDLPTQQIANPAAEFSALKSEQIEFETWQDLPDAFGGVLAAMWSDLVNLVDVKDAELPDSVLFDPELRYFLQQNLRLELASARLSVLRRDTGNLHASRVLLMNLLQTYYDVDDAAIGSILDKLRSLDGLELAPELPDIGASLSEIRRFRKAKSHVALPALPESP